MRKQLLSVILLFLIALLVVVCLPYVMGSLAEKRIKQLAVELSDAPDIVISVDEYQRHWFSASAQLTVHIASLAQFNLPSVQLKVTQQVKHGPMMWVNGRLLFGLAYSDSQIVPTATTQQMLQQVAQFLTNNELPELSISTLIRFNRSIVVYAGLDEFSLVSSQEEATVNWQGFTSNNYISSDGSTTQATSMIKPLTIHTPLFDFSLGNVHLKFTETDQWPENYHYRGSIQAEQLGFADEEDKFSLSLGDLALDLALDTQDKLFSGEVKLALGAVAFEQFAMKRGTLKISVKNLDVPTLDEILKLLSTLNLNNLTVEQARLLGFVLLPKLPQLLTASTQVRVDDFSFVLPEGTLAIQGYLQLADQADLSHWSAFWREMQAKLSVSVPSDFLRAWLFERNAEILVNEQQMQQVIAEQLTTDKQASQSIGQTALTQLVGLDDQQLAALATQRADQQIEEWMANHYLQQRGADYRLELQLSDGLIRLNGQILTLNDWLN